MKMTIKKNTIWTFLSILLYKIALDLSYYFVILDIFGYEGYTLTFNNVKFFESFFLLIVIFILMPKKLKKLSDIIVWLLILFSYVPMLTLFSFMDQPRIYMYAVSGFWALIFLLLPMPEISVPFLKQLQSKVIFYSIFTGLSGVALFLIYNYFGFSVNFDLTKVYDIRSQYVEAEIPLAGYLFNWVGYIVNPTFLALFLTKRKWIGVALTVILQLFIFSSTGMKAFILALPYVPLLIWIITRKNPFGWIAITLVGTTLIGMLSYFLISDIWISNLTIRRMLFVPAKLSFYYYDFFSKNGPTFLSQHRILRNFLDYPYDLDPPHLIGAVYFNRPEMGANNGIYADAYMNFGFWGFVLWGVFLVIILKLIDSISRKKDIKIAVVPIGISTVALTNSALLTCLLTHGLLLSLIILYLLPKKSHEKDLSYNHSSSAF